MEPPLGVPPCCQNPKSRLGPRCPKLTEQMIALSQRIREPKNMPCIFARTRPRCSFSVQLLGLSLASGLGGMCRTYFVMRVIPGSRRLASGTTVSRKRFVHTQGVAQCRLHSRKLLSFAHDPTRQQFGMLARRPRHACYVGKHYIGTEALFYAVAGTPRADNRHKS